MAANEQIHDFLDKRLDRIENKLDAALDRFATKKVVSMLAIVLLATICTMLMLHGPDALAAMLSTFKAIK